MHQQSVLICDVVSQALFILWQFLMYLLDMNTLSVRHLSSSFIHLFLFQIGLDGAGPRDDE